MIRKKAWELLCESGASLLPIDPHQIIGIQNWGFVSVGELAKKTELKRLDIICGLDGEVRYCPKSSKYCIIYDETAHEDRIPYSLCHEIGHIVLDHILDLYRANKSGHELTDEEYEFFEYEADVFASELLMPTPVLMEIGLLKPMSIKRFCGVSKKAANTKASFLASYMVFKADLDITAKIKQQFKDFINLYQKQYHLITEEHYIIENFIDEAAATGDDLKTSRF